MYNQGKIINRLLGRPNNSDLPTDVVNNNPTVPTSYRPNAPQSILHATDEPVSCLDRSQDGTTVVLAGRHVLKTVHIDGTNVHEGVDVRAAITAQFANKGSSAMSLASDQLSIKDVKISPGHTNGPEPTIFTACANGKIFMYDLTRLASGVALDFIQTSEGSRQVNKLDINPHRATWMLSGGQDGIVRCLDIKAPHNGRNGPTFGTLARLRCNADGIRDVKWAPKDGMVFACATESGAVMKWDIRKPAGPLLKIAAHDTQKGVTSISWHPDGNHLISAGFDAKCHVWDLSKTAEKRQKAKWTINAPAPVASVAWRPGLWSATAQGRRAAQVAVAYDDGGQQRRNGITSVHIWDLARPTMPYKEIDFENSPMALLWHDQDLLWAVGQEGFRQCDVAFSPKVMDRQPLSNLDFSSRGDVVMFLEERAETSRRRSSIRTREVVRPSSYSSSPTGQMLSLSRSDSEEDVMGSFLGPKQQSGGKRRRSRSRPAQPLSTTPPSGSGVEDQVISLEKAIKLTTPFRPQQVMAIGRIPTSPLPDMYRLFSQHYLETLERELPNSEEAEPFDRRIIKILNLYARFAGSVSQFRLAQTWRVLSFAMDLLLQSRSRYHLERRLTNGNRKTSPSQRHGNDERASPVKGNLSSTLQTKGGETPRKTLSVTSLDSHQTSARPLMAGDIDTESNLATPLARPVMDQVVDADDTVRKSTPVTEVGSFSLGPAMYSERGSPRRRLDSAPLSILSQESQISSTEGYDFYDLDAIDALPIAIDVPRKKEPLRLESTELTSPNARRKPPIRHDSDENFAQIFPLDTSRQASVLTNSSGGSLKSAFRQHSQNHSLPESYEKEFSSRIRGKQIAESLEQRSRRPLPTLERRGSSALTEDHLVSQATTDTFGSESIDFAPVRPLSKLRVDPSTVQRDPSQHDQSPIRPQDNLSPSITETDFLYWDDDPEYPYPISSYPSFREGPPPINPYKLIFEALAFETGRSPLHASALVLLLKPLVPDSVIESHQAAAVLRQHHDRLKGMKLFVEAALLRNLCVRGWPAGIDIWGDNYPSIFRPAQERVAVGYACAQCHKPREISRSSSESTAIWRCERCRALVAPCAVCGHREGNMNSAAVSVFAEGLSEITARCDEILLSTWWYCPGCSHGGHANCLQEWHGPATPSAHTTRSNTVGPETIHDDVFQESNSDGCCPLDGCGHACLPGRWRNESSTARTEELGRAIREQYRGIVTGLKKTDSTHNKHQSQQKAVPALDGSMHSIPAGSVRGDSVEVPQSRAVESVRETLANNHAGADRESRSGATDGLMGILSSSPGRGGGGGAGPNGLPGERERRKSVKFAGSAGEDRR